MKFVNIHNIKLNIAVLLRCAIFFILVSCEEDLTNLNSKKKTDFPSQVIYNSKIVQRDSGFVKLRAMAPIIEKYELVDSPYVVAKKGIKLEFFDKKKPNQPGNLTAQYAKINEKRKFYEAKGNVKILTNDGQRFAMQSVYWDQMKNRIYTTDTVYVTDKDGSTMIGANGMTAKDDFSSYTFFNNSGEFSDSKLPANNK